MLIAPIFCNIEVLSLPGLFPLYLSYPSIGLWLGALCVLLLLSAFFSSAETGMLALDRHRLRHLSKQGHPGAKRVSSLLERKDRLLGLILLGNNLVNLSASAIATLLALRLFGEAGVAGATLLLTLVILIFAEIGPKTAAAFYPERIAWPASWVLRPLLIVLQPLVSSINAFSNSLLRLVGIDPTSKQDAGLSSKELISLLDDEAAQLPAQYRNMLVNILNLESITVDDIMVPRAEVIGIDIDAPPAKIMETLSSHRLTRIPVYEGDMGHIIGIMDVRDAPRILGSDLKNQSRLLRRAMLTPHFVPQGTTLPTQMQNFQAEKSSMGIVVDEYGAVQGIVTLQRILEEIVGKVNLGLRVAKSRQNIHRQPDGSCVVDGTTTLHELSKALDLSFAAEEASTLNGLILEKYEELPQAGVVVELDGHTAEVLSVRKDNVVDKVRLRIDAQKAAANDDTDTAPSA